MQLRLRLCSVLVLAPALALAGCGDDEEEERSRGCSVADQTGCAAGLSCEEVQGGEPACFAPLYIEGRVFDATTEAGIQDARVIARDPNDAALSRVAITDAQGAYRLQVAARRDANGNPVAASVTLRADAAGYDTFPKAPRVALPIDLATAAGDPPTIQTAATDVALLSLPNSDGLGTISGTVAAENPGGTLVVAGGVTGAADFDGAFTIFNVPAGDYTVRGYAKGLQLDSASVSVAAGQETTGVVLNGLGVATAVVDGNIQIVNAPGGSETSVILVVADTFNATAARGEAPPGLRMAPVSGAFRIEGVPDGTYKVLAAFENDGLVRDPDTSIGGTDIVEITVAGGDLSIAEGFKVTEALTVISPGAETLEEVSGTPEFVWADDSSEGGYEVQVYDAFGTLVWEDLAIPEVSGNADVRVTYGGAPLEAGMIYQFRATSMSKDNPPVPISKTEDLRGVFQYR